MTPMCISGLKGLFKELMVEENSKYKQITTDFVFYFHFI